jgi:hypothetical protein
MHWQRWRKHGDPLTRKNGHGRTDTAEWQAWSNMRQRCNNPDNPKWPLYGGRGIQVCAEWQDDFPAFLAHVGPRPGPSYSIDRIDNERGYEPGNVRWATRSQQVRNSRPRQPRRRRANARPGTI